MTYLQFLAVLFELHSCGFFKHLRLLHFIWLGVNDSCCSLHNCILKDFNFIVELCNLLCHELLDLLNYFNVLLGQL